MLNINYKRGKGQSIIDKASFILEDDRHLVLSIVNLLGVDGSDSEQVVAQNVRIAIKDSNFGEDELFVELGIKDGIDLIRILQRLFRQVANFEPEAIADEEG